MAWYDTLLNLGLPALGGYLGSQNQAQQAGTTTNTFAPWNPIQPYLVGGTGTSPGIANQAGAIYNQQRNGMPDYLQQAYQNYINTTQNQNTTQNSALRQNITNVLSGANTPNITPVAPIRGVANVNSTNADVSSAMKALGATDPSKAFQQMLTGKANTETLDPVVTSALRRMSDNFNEQVLPQIGQRGVASGQFGSSRHGVAQGLAAKGLALAQGDTSANMYNNAYNQAQALMGSAAGQLGNMATQTAVSNAQRADQVALQNAQNALATQVQNSNLGLQNNNQALQAYVNRLGGLQTAGNLLNQQQTTQANLGLGGINAANAANNYNWQQLGAYQSAIQPLGGLGGSQSQPYYTNPVSGALGGAVLGGQLANQLTGGR